MKNEHSEIHFLRLAATMAVVMLHTSSGIYGNWDNYTSDANSDKSIFALYIHLSEWGVPVFLLISGALLLSPERDTSYKAIFKKYLRRIFWALLIFALPMTLSESFLENRGESILYTLYDGVTDWLRGHSWAHLWYLYMLIGIYLITPIIKPFAVAANDRDLEIALCTLFFLSMLLPTISDNMTPIEGYLLLSPPYIFIYMLGYYLHSRAEHHKIFRSKGLWIAVFAAATAATTLGVFTKDSLGGWTELAWFPLAIAIFMLAKLTHINWGIARKAAPYCFGVYLLHPVFVNLSYKILNITPLNSLDTIPCAITIPLFFVIFTALAFGAAYIVSKIPFIKKLAI
ncbi:MAG: acyltransferase family protein [Bacteroidaceae bacterium]|nr:acyltransferase family protein [Bacteroidaceae bacterium]